MGAVAVAGVQTASWDPPTLAREDTLEFLTVGPDEGEHWSRVWAVAVDDELYVRLGRRGSRGSKGTRLSTPAVAPELSARPAMRSSPG